MTILKAAITYFALVFAAGFALGTFRVLVAVPLIGEFNAVLVELPVILAATAFAAGWSVRQFAVSPQLDQRLLVGGIAFLLLQAAEFELAVVTGLSPSAYLARLATAAGSVGLLAQTVVVVMPVSVRR